MGYGGEEAVMGSIKGSLPVDWTCNAHLARRSGSAVGGSILSSRRVVAWIGLGRYL